MLGFWPDFPRSFKWALKSHWIKDDISSFQLTGRFPTAKAPTPFTERSVFLKLCWAGYLSLPRLRYPTKLLFRIRCNEIEYEYLLAFSHKLCLFFLSCKRKRAGKFGKWLSKEVYNAVLNRKFSFQYTQNPMVSSIW